jgi:tetraacyldisaccharide 4'-kinase
MRRLAYRFHLFASSSLSVPLIIVGNIRIGGTGKTPLVIALAKALQKIGFQPGVIARGYLSSNDQAGGCREVLVSDEAVDVGDEPALMAQQLTRVNIPVWIGRKRGQTALSLLAKFPRCDVIICDDGLQHYALRRVPVRHGGHDIEIVVQDARLNGNGFMLPSGPLREPSSRGRDLTVEMTIEPLRVNSVKTYIKSDGALSTDLNTGFNGQFDPKRTQAITAKMGNAYPMASPTANSIPNPMGDLNAKQGTDVTQDADSSLETMPLTDLAHKFITLLGPEFHVAAIAGIANPEKFFTPLRQIFPQLSTQSFPDHEGFSSNPFAQFPTNRFQLVLITEKDAVKCRKWSDNRVWVVPLEADIPDAVIHWMDTILRQRPG